MSFCFNISINTKLQIAVLAITGEVGKDNISRYSYQKSILGTQSVW